MQDFFNNARRKIEEIVYTLSTKGYTRDMKLFEEMKVNKKLAALLAALGFVYSYFAPDFLIDLEIMKQGMVAGLVIGLFWSLVRYVKFGENGIAKSQQELGKVFAYLLYFLVGYGIGYLIFNYLVF